MVKGSVNYFPTKLQGTAGYLTIESIEVKTFKLTDNTLKWNVAGQSKSNNFAGSAASKIDMARIIC